MKHNFVDFIRYLKRQYIDSTAVKLGLVDYSLDLSCKTKHPSGSEREYKVDTPLEWKAVKNRLLSHQENVLVCEVRQKAYVVKAAACSTSADAIPKNASRKRYCTTTRERVKKDRELDDYLKGKANHTLFTFARSDEQEQLLLKMEEGERIVSLTVLTQPNKLSYVKILKRRKYLQGSLLVKMQISSS